MKISFKLNKNDMWVFGKYATFKSIRFKLNLAKNTIFLTIIFLLYSIFSKFNFIETLIFTLALVAGYVYLQFAVLKMKMTKVYAKKGVYYGDHVLELTDQGIMEVLPIGEDFHAFGEYVAFVEHKGYIYVFWGENTGNVIPVRSFSNEAEKNAFLSILNSNIKKKA